MTEHNHNASDSEVSEAHSASADSGRAEATPPRAADGTNPLTAILKRIRAHTRRAAPPKLWKFLKTDPWVRRLKGNACELATALQSEFANDELVTAGILIPGPNGDELQLSPLFGDSDSSFVIICDPAGMPIDAISARRTLAGQHPPCLKYSPALCTKLPFGVQERVFVAASDDDLSVLHRLGCQVTSAAGLESLSTEQARELFQVRKYWDVNQRPKYELIVPAWQIAEVRLNPDSATLKILKCLEDIERSSDLSSSTLIDVWIPTSQEFSAISKGLSSGDRKILCGRISASLQYSSRCSVGQALQFFRDGRQVDYVTARSRLVRALERSTIAPQAAEVRAALDQLRRAFKTSVTDIFSCPNGHSHNGWEPMRRLMAAEIAERWFEGQSIVSAARSVMAGEFPRELHSIDPQRLLERLRIVETFAKLYGAGQRTNNPQSVKRARTSRRRSQQAKLN